MIPVSNKMQNKIEALIQRPLFKILSYDITQATGETWGTIIRGNINQIPIDLTNIVSKITWSYDKLSISLADDTGSFDPDFGISRFSISPGRGIRLIEGFEGLPEDEWIVTFSGIIQGSYTWSRKRGSLSLVSFNVFSRESNQSWKRRSVTSKSFTVGTDWSVMFFQLVQDSMGLEKNEIAVQEPWNLLFDKVANQIVNISPWEGLSSLASGNLNRLWFNGKGQLASYPITLDRVDLTISDEKLISSYSQSGNDQEVINKVIVIYLDNVLTKVIGTQQSLGTANITTGFFDLETKLDVFWSEDKMQRAENVELIVKSSINQNDLGISIGSEKLQINDEFGGQLIITVSAFVSALAVAGIAGIAASAFIPNETVGIVNTVVQVGPSGTGTGIGTATGETINTGTAIFAVSIILVLLAMMILGTGIYEIVGRPYDYAFLEKQVVALIDNIPFWEEKEKIIKNDFVSTEEASHQIALAELLFEQSKGRPRNLILINDPRIERGDIIQLPSGVRIFVQNISKTIVRGEQIAMSVQGFKSVV